MRDVVFEWYVPYVINGRQRLLKAVMVSAALVFFVGAEFFAAFMLFPALNLCGTRFFLFRSWRYEYEYVYVNGDFTISKIIRKEKRKDVTTRPAPNLRSFSPGGRLQGDGR